jgi:hypothetical protein
MPLSSSLCLQVNTPRVQTRQAAVTTVVLLTKVCGAVLAYDLLPPHPWLSISCLCTLLAAGVQPGRHMVFALQVGVRVCLCVTFVRGRE